MEYSIRVGRLRTLVTMAAGIIAIGSAVVIPSNSIAQQSVKDFYTGKQISIIVRTTVGGNYDILSRLFARHMGKHLPGNPSMIVVNMPGGGGIKAANYLASAAPKNGTVLSIIGQGLPVDQALKVSKQLKADLRKFNWIANIVNSNSVLAVWHTSPTKTLEDAKKRRTTIGTTGAGSVSVQFPTFYNNVLGTKLKLVIGYPGGKEINLAMERGEVEGRGSNTYEGYMSSSPTYIPNKIIIPIIQIGMEKDLVDPNTPLLLDQPVKPEYKPLLGFMSRGVSVGRPFATTPGVPPERVAALRKAFYDTIKYPAFVADAARQKLTIRPKSGESLAQLINDLINSPQAVKDQVKKFIKPGPNELN